jgi:hypothetical protein
MQAHISGVFLVLGSREWTIAFLWSSVVLERRQRRTSGLLEYAASWTWLKERWREGRAWDWKFQEEEEDGCCGGPDMMIEWWIVKRE